MNIYMGVSQLLGARASLSPKIYGICFGLQTSTKNSSLHGVTSSAAAVSVSSPVSFLAFDCSHHVIRLTHDSP